MIGFEPDQVSQDMSSWINLTLEKSTAAHSLFHNIPELDGAELYLRPVILFPVKCRGRAPDARP